jgi:hypothetical protein
MKKKKFKQKLIHNGIEVLVLPFVNQYLDNMKYANLPYPFSPWPNCNMPLNFKRADRYGYRDIFHLSKNWQDDMKNYDDYVEGEY